MLTTKHTNTPNNLLELSVYLPQQIQGEIKARFKMYSQLILKQALKI